MNINYLEELPKVENRFEIDLSEDEKVVFTAKLSMFGTETDALLGADAQFTLTNKSIIVNNGAGVWAVDLAKDVVSCKKVKSKFLLIFKSVYFCVMLNKEIVFSDGKHKHSLTGFHFYFKDEDTEKFENIMNNLNHAFN